MKHDLNKGRPAWEFAVLFVLAALSGILAYLSRYHVFGLDEAGGAIYLKSVGTCILCVIWIAIKLIWRAPG